MALVYKSKDHYIYMNVLFFKNNNHRGSGTFGKNVRPISINYRFGVRIPTATDLSRKSR